MAREAWNEDIRPAFSRVFPHRMIVPPRKIGWGETRSGSLMVPRGKVRARPSLAPPSDGSMDTRRELRSGQSLPAAFRWACRQHNIKPTRLVLIAQVRRQQMDLMVRMTLQPGAGRWPQFRWRARFRVSTSRFGLGQIAGSNQTPLGLHRIAEKIGGGQPIGTVFRSRQPIGLTWAGMPDASIAHRILWLAGLEPGFNCGGHLDSHSRYIYIHGVGDETTIGRPASRGCIHLAAGDLLPLFDRVPTGTLVWIEP